jgi:hypothetical protein
MSKGKRRRGDEGEFVISTRRLGRAAGEEE